MRRALPLLTAALLLAGCSSSTLPEDDQQFCADQEDELAPVRDVAEGIVDGDRHWSSEEEPVTLRDLQVTPATYFVSAFEPQDPTLAGLVSDVSTTLTFLGSDLAGGPDAAFADDAASSRDTLAALDALQEFCDAEG